MKNNNPLVFTLFYFLGATIVCFIPIVLSTIFLAGFNDSGATFKTVPEALAWSLQMMLFPVILVLPIYLILLGASVYIKRNLTKPYTCFF